MAPSTPPGSATDPPPFTNAKNKVYSGQQTAFYLEQKDVTMMFNKRSITVVDKERQSITFQHFSKDELSKISIS